MTLSITARQSHGFRRQDEFIEENGLTSYPVTSHFDAFDSNNNKYEIKTTKLGNEISFADLKRKIDIDEDFHLHIDFYENDKENIIESCTILVKLDNWFSYFPFNAKELIFKMKLEMKTITNNYEDDEKWQLFCDKYKRLWGKNVVELRFKRDHKKQKRIQCAVSFKSFIRIILNDNIILGNKN